MIADRFLALHRAGSPLLLPNPWDVGSARLFASLGFQALATTSAGFAATKGRLDGGVTLDEVVAHASDIAAATDLPVNVDFEDGFADTPDAVATNVARLAGTGVAGCSIEDFTRRPGDPIYEIGEGVERLAAAVSAAHAGPHQLVVTARAENFLHGRSDLDDTITRLQSFQEAGADVLYAPGLTSPDDIRNVVSSVDRPVNVLAFPGAPTVAELARIGVARISVGSAFNLVAMGAVLDAAVELRDEGTYGFWTQAAAGRRAAQAAFGRSSFG